MTRPAWVHNFTNAELRNRLTGGELQLLRLVEGDVPNKGIATHLGLSGDEVTSRLASLHRTLGLTATDRPTWLQRQLAQTPN